MDRRAVLLALGSVGSMTVGGCLGTGSGRSSRTLSISAVDDGPGPLSFEVSVSTAELATETVPTLSISVRNTGEERVEWSYGGGTSGLPFPQGITDARAGVLVIGLTEEINSQLVGVSEGCSRVDAFLRADGIQTTSLSPGARIEERYAIVGVGNELTGSCPDAGTYRMDHEMTEIGTWGFEIRLE